MANFACDPMPFVLFGFHIEDGWQRPARARVALGGEAPRRHEEYAILTLNPAPPPNEAAAVLDQLVDQLEDQFPMRVLSHFLSPLGLGLVQFGSPMQRQGLINLSPINLGNGFTLSVARHDEGINLRTCNYSRVCNIMMLGFPLDFQNIDFISVCCSGLKIVICLECLLNVWFFRLIVSLRAWLFHMAPLLVVMEGLGPSLLIF